MRPRIVFTIAVLAAFCGGTAAFAGGETSGQFLKIANGARPAAMGEAYTGAADDVNSIMWNPAGLAGVNSFQQTLSYNSWFEGIGISYLGLACPLQTSSAFGFGLEYVSMGEIGRANNTGGDMGTYGASDLLFVLSYGRKLRTKLDVGANIKIIQSKIESAGATGMAADIGMMYHVQPRLQLGGTVNNIGTGLKYGEKGTGSPLPMTVKAGASYLLTGALLATADIDLPSDSAAGFHLGGEYLYTRFKDLQIAVRFGFKTATMSYLDALSGLSFGFGVQKNEWGVDYALAPYGLLGMTHRLNFNLRFVPGGVKAAETPVSAADAAFNVAVPVRQATAAGQRRPEDVYYEALQWYNEKINKGKLSQQDQLLILEKLREKFEPTGVDMSSLKETIDRLKTDRK